MGIDLHLMPVTLDTKQNCYSHTILSFSEMDTNLWHDITDSKIEKKMPYPISSWFGDNYQSATKDPWGTPIGYALAGELMQFKEHGAVMNNHINIAIWAYLECLPRDKKVVLYWH